MCSYQYYTARELESWLTYGVVSVYPGGGYVVDLARNRNESLEIIEKLKANIWIDRGTRAVLIEFTVYNANINMFSTAKYMFTF